MPPKPHPQYTNSLKKINARWIITVFLTYLTPEKFLVSWFLTSLVSIQLSLDGNIKCSIWLGYSHITSKVGTEKRLELMSHTVGTWKLDWWGRTLVTVLAVHQCCPRRVGSRQKSGYLQVKSECFSYRSAVKKTLKTLGKTSTMGGRTNSLGFLNAEGTFNQEFEKA